MGLAEYEQVREHFQRERPSIDELMARGDVAEVVSHGEYLDLRALLAALKGRREQQGLSLTDVAERASLGDLSLNVAHTCDDEIGDLQDSLARLVTASFKSRFRGCITCLRLNSSNCRVRFAAR